MSVADSASSVMAASPTPGAAAAAATGINSSGSGSGNVAVETVSWVLHDLGWNLAYIVFVCWLYFFHSPIRDRTRAEKSDWYAQLLKIIQVWCLVHITFFHLLGHYITTARSRETEPSTVFFPLLAFFISLFSLFHREKRRFMMVITYSLTTTMLVLNSLIMALMLTLHLGACTSTEEHIGHFGIISNVICPQYAKTEPVPIILHLALIGVCVISADYYYKKRHNFRVQRTLLWSDSYTMRQDEKALHEGHRREPQGEPMVEWYSVLAASTGLKLFFGGALRFLTFDFRSVEDEMTPKVFEVGKEVENADKPPEGSSPRAAKPDQPKAPPSRGVGAFNRSSSPREQPSQTSVDKEATPSSPTGKQKPKPNVAFGSGKTTIPKSTSSPELAQSGGGAGSRKRATGTTKTPSPTDEGPKPDGRRRKVSTAGAGMPNTDSPTHQAAANPAPSFARSFSSPQFPTTALGSGDDDDYWFDFVADIGDGFNSTYEIARLMAQPVLAVGMGKVQSFTLQRLTEAVRDRWHRLAVAGRLPLKVRLNSILRKSASAVDGLSAKVLPDTDARVRKGYEDPLDSPEPEERDDAVDGKTEVDLPRGNFVIIGGDLAYPSPTEEVWQKRFFGPWSDALPRSLPTRERERRHCHRTQISQTEPDQALIREVQHSAMHSQAAAARRSSTGSSGPNSPGPVSPTVFSPQGEATSEDVKDLGVLTAPLLFAIPGNHDWFDGIGTFRSKIIAKSWLGGWFMPQRTSYFVLSLPNDWFIFCLDNGLFEDIDPNQLQYFLQLTETKLKANSSVVIVTHEPSWLNDHQHMMPGQPHSQQRVHKLELALGHRLRMRVAGDIHNYSRYSPTRAGKDKGMDMDTLQGMQQGGPRENPTIGSPTTIPAMHPTSSPAPQLPDDNDPESDYPILVVSGGGGAFLHGSGVSPAKVRIYDKFFSRRGWYPFGAKTLSLARRVFGFRLVNWKFDIFGGLLYFLLIVSLLPLGPKIHNPVQVHSASEFVSLLISTTFELIAFIFTETTVSFSACLLIVFVNLGLISPTVASWKRIPSGLFFGFLHIFCAVFLLAFMHHSMEIMIQSNLVLSTREHWRSSVEEELKASGRDMMNWLRLYSEDGSVMGLVLTPVVAVLEWVRDNRWITETLSTTIRGFDVTEGYAYLRQQVTSPDGQFGEFSASCTRLQRIAFWAHFMWFYWLLATPTVASLLGSFLWYCVTVLDCGYDPAYSAFRIEDYKHFLRFRLNKKNGELEVFVVGVDHVPRQWEADPRHEAEAQRYQDLVEGTEEDIPPKHLWEYPSVWRPKRRHLNQKLPWAYHGPKIIDRFVCKPTPAGHSSFEQANANDHLHQYPPVHNNASQPDYQ